jgi:hypothetical protein
VKAWETRGNLKGYEAKGKEGTIPVSKERTRSERGIVVKTETGTKIYDDSKRARHGTMQSRCGGLGEREIEGEATRLSVGARAFGGQREPGARHQSREYWLS